MRGNNTDIITGSSSNMLGKEDVIRPFQIEEVMQERKQLLEKVINRCRYELKGMPEGTLYACPRQNGNSYRYYLKHESSGQSYYGKSSTGKSHAGEIYLKKEDGLLKKQLAQKKYYQKLLKASERELNYINRFLENFKGDSITGSYLKLNEGIRKLISPVAVDDETFLKQWGKKQYIGLGFGDNDTTSFFTNKGERVRSKSEIMIANLLDKYNIPYRYEEPIVLRDGAIVHPDFTVVNVKKRKTVYWEHLGRMDDTDYIISNIRKFSDYKRSGIIPGLNLILTYETRREAIGTKEIENIITEFLL